MIAPARGAKIPPTTNWGGKHIILAGIHVIDGQRVKNRVHSIENLAWFKRMRWGEGRAE